MYVRPHVEGEPTTFGVSGKLWRDSLVMYDRATESLWSQLLGRAVAGPMKGTELEEVPSEVTTWGEWRERHPDTVVLKKGSEQASADARRGGSAYDDYHASDAIGVRGTENPDDRLPGKSLVYGLRRGEEYAAVPFSVLEENPVLNANAFGVPIVVFSPPGENAAMAYTRRVDGETLTFERVAGTEARLTARDTETGSTWSWERGECLQGAFEGKQLERLDGIPVYWGIWAQFHPDTAVVRSEE